MNGPPDLIGDLPDLTGLACEQLLVQQYWYRGELAEEANVTYLRFSGIWHRVCLDAGVVFWRLRSPWDERLEDWGDFQYPVIDLSDELALRGEVLDFYEVNAVAGREAKVRFVFRSGRTLTFRNIGDRTSYHMSACEEH